MSRKFLRFNEEVMKADILANSLTCPLDRHLLLCYNVFSKGGKSSYHP